MKRRGSGRLLALFRADTLSEQPIDQRDLSQRDRRNRRPREPFAQPQAGLFRFAQPKLNSGGTDFDDVAVPQNGALSPVTVDGGESVWRGCHDRSC